MENMISYSRKPRFRLYDTYKNEDFWELHVGDSYYFLSLIPPFEVVINKGVITDKLIDEISEGIGTHGSIYNLGNMFRSRRDAEVVVKEVLKIFESLGELTD